MFTRVKGERDRERDRERDTASFRRRKNPRPPMLSLPRSNSIKFLPSKTGRIEEETACGIMWSVAARRGRRRTHREDTYATLPFITDAFEEPVSVFAIFDGHGGKRAAEYASKRLPEVFLEKLRVCSDVKQSLEYAFLATDAELVAEFSKRNEDIENTKTAKGSSLGASPVHSGVGRRSSSLFSRKSRLNFGDSPTHRKSPREDGSKERGLFDGGLRGGKSKADEHISNAGLKTSKGCGCTATVVAMVGNKMSIAHVGDSGAVLSTNKGVRRLCEDHRPGRPDEQKRIESSGGLVLEVCGTQRVNGVLAVSRSIGDAELKEFVIAKPEVNEISLRGDEEFVVVATDGLWDVVSDEESVEMVREILRSDWENGEEESVKRLIERAWDRGSNDDTCVLVINLVKYGKVYRRDVADDSEFLSPVDGMNIQPAGKGNDFRRRVAVPGEGQLNELPLSVELITPRADVAPTPRVRKKGFW